MTEYVIPIDNDTPAVPAVPMWVNGRNIGVTAGVPFDATDQQLEVLGHSHYRDDYQRTPPEDAGDGGAAESQAIVFADFKNGSYTLNGEAATLADLFVDPGTGAPARFDASDVVAGVGLTNPHGGAQPANSYTTPVLTAGAMAPFGVGFVALFTFTQRTDTADDLGEMIFSAYNASSEYQEIYARKYFNDQFYAYLYSTGPEDWPEIETYLDAPQPLLKMAVRFDDVGSAFSLNGQPVKKCADAHANPLTTVMLSINGTAGSVTVVEKIEFWPSEEYTDAELVTMSAVT